MSLATILSNQSFATTTVVNATAAAATGAGIPNNTGSGNEMWDRDGSVWNTNGSALIGTSTQAHGSSEMLLTSAARMLFSEMIETTFTVGYSQTGLYGHVHRATSAFNGFYEVMWEPYSNGYFQIARNGSQVVGWTNPVATYDPTATYVLASKCANVGATVVITVNIYKNGVSVYNTSYTDNSPPNYTGQCGLRISERVSGSPSTATVSISNLIISTDDFVESGDAFAANSLNVVSPCNWESTTGMIAANNPGAYFRFSFAGTAFNLVFDVSPTYEINAQGIQGITYSIDGGAPVDLSLNYTEIQLPSGPGSTSNATKSVQVSSVLKVAGLANATHLIRVWFKSNSNAYNGWLASGNATFANPANELRFRYLILPATASASPLTQTASAANAIIAYGDSITEGGSIEGTVYNCRGTYAFALADALSAELGVIGWQGQGWTYAPIYKSIVQFHDTTTGKHTWDLLRDGVARTFPSNLTAIFVHHGTNDGIFAASNGAAVTADIADFLPKLRAAIPASCWIIMIIPIGGGMRSAITSAVNTYAATDAKCLLVDLGLTSGNPESTDGFSSAFGTSNGVLPSGATVSPTGTAAHDVTGATGTLTTFADGVHPTPFTHARLAAFVAAKASRAMAPATVARTSLHPWIF